MSENNRESALTAPSDRNLSVKYKPDQNVPPLTTEETSEAMKTLNVTSFVERFPAVERRYADPAVDLQKIGLISFIPAKGATPNDKGVYGFAKLRGNYPTENEANARAEFIIRNVDSYHPIFHAYVGRPFPLTESSDYSKEVSRVDLRKETTESISADVKSKREKDLQEIEEIKKREQELLEDVKKEEEATDDRYTTLKVKKAQLTWTYLETVKKVEQMRGLIAKARHEINELDKTNPELKENYMNKYIEARKQAGLPVDKHTTDTSFIRFMVEDVSIPEIDAEYEAMYGTEESTLEHMNDGEAVLNLEDSAWGVDEKKDD